MKLHRVTVEHTFFMVSDDVEVEAEECARQAVQEDSMLDLITDVEVTQLEDIPKEWLNAQPYGKGKNVRSCAEWFKLLSESSASS
jgi:hypothetical protein